MKKLLIVIFLVAISVSVVACEDGKNGVMGLTGPSGIEELNATCENEGEEIVSDVDAAGVVTWSCEVPVAP